MATKDNSPGLFTRVANFVRSPRVPSSDADKLTQLPSSENSALAIKHLLARKAHNDAVRKREFALLRKIRLAAGGDVGKLEALENTTAHSTGFSVMEERTSTLKKIDEIEAQMSKQWWKNRQDGISQVAAQPSPVATSVPAQKESLSEFETHNSFASTLLTDSGIFDTAAITTTFFNKSRFQNSHPGPMTNLVAGHNKERQFEPPVDSTISISKMMSIEEPEVFSDPVLEDAAIRFANGDDAGTEAVLHEAMRAKDIKSESLDAWAAALFDLYRGTGQQQSFDGFALAYAKRFDRSAPIWFSAREQLGVRLDSGMQAAAPVQLPGSWTCPVELDVLALNLLLSVLDTKKEVVQLDWLALKVISPNALLLLAKVFALCCDKPFVLRLQGERVLSELLRVQTSLGDNRVEPVWWKLRLDLMRILGLQAEFELVAMDYCVTYEVSPPSWLSAKSQLLSLQDAAQEPVQECALQSSTVRQESETTIALAGELIGNASGLLQRLELGQDSANDLLVNCEYLIRVDFVAAGSILNWVTDCHLLGKQIKFFQVPRLVAVFFCLLGINEHAKIKIRVN